MYVGKRFPLKGVILWSKKYLLYFIIIDTVPAVLFYFLDWKWLAIPWQPIALVGIGVSFYLGFKNNSSYDRLWEARKIWGGIVNSSRSFTIMTRDFISNDHAKSERTEDDLHQFRKTIVHRHVAWLNALTYQLRVIKPWEHDASHEVEMRKKAGIHEDDDHFEKLRPYLPKGEFEYIMSKGNKASHLISLQSKHFRKLKDEGHIDDFRHMELEKLLAEFYTLQGKAERIKNFPFPRQYATVNYLFVWMFIGLVPFGMLYVFSGAVDPDWIWLSIPFSIIVSWVFILMEMVGDYSENPFEGLYNDVPITSMARGIEIDIRQMLDEEDLPPPVKPGGINGDYLL